MDSDGIHPDVLRVARLALEVGGYTARQQRAYLDGQHPELTTAFVSHLNGVGGHSMIMECRSRYGEWLAFAIFAQPNCGEAPWTPAQEAVLRALLAEKLL